MARPFRHQHGIASRDQPARQCGVFGLRHLRPAQRVLGGSVRDQRQRKRPRARRTKQQRVRRNVAIWRWHQPLLSPVRLAFRALSAELSDRPGLRMGAMQATDGTRTTRAKSALKNAWTYLTRAACGRKRRRDDRELASTLPATNQIRPHFFANAARRRNIPGHALPFWQAMAARSAVLSFFGTGMTEN